MRTKIYQVAGIKIMKSYSGRATKRATRSIQIHRNYININLSKLKNMNMEMANMSDMEEDEDTILEEQEAGANWYNTTNNQSKATDRGLDELLKRTLLYKARIQTQEEEETVEYQDLTDEEERESTESESSETDNESIMEYTEDQKDNQTDRAEGWNKI